MKAKDNYNLHIIGNGRITLAVLKHILEKKLFKKIGKIIIWDQYRHEFDHEIKKPYINEDLIGIYAENIGISSINIKFKTFKILDDISFEEGSLVVILARYNLNKFIYLKENIKFDYSQQFHCDVFFSRIQPFFHDVCRYQRYGHLEMLGKTIIESKNKLEQIINDSKLVEAFGQERLYNLPHSVIGIKELSLALFKKNINNITVFNLVNEVDATSYIIQKYSCLNKIKIYSPCDNDRMRAMFFVKKYLKKNKIPCKNLLLRYIGPHNHLGFIPIEAIVIDGNKISSTQKKVWEAIIADIVHKTSEFGESIFKYKRSSDEDTAYGLYKAIDSFFCHNAHSYFRVLRYSASKDVFVSEEGCFKRGKFIKLCNVEECLDMDTVYKLGKIYKTQSALNKRILGCLCQNY